MWQKKCRIFILGEMAGTGRADGSPWAVAGLAPASNYQCSRRDFLPRALPLLSRRRMQKGNAQLVHNPLSAAIVCSCFPM